MDNSKKAMQARFDEWSAKIKEREESGMTIPDFCQVYDISVSKYNYWARRVKQVLMDVEPREIVDVTDIVKGASDSDGISVVARSNHGSRKDLSVLCFRITSDTSEKLINNVLRAFINV